MLTQLPYAPIAYSGINACRLYNLRAAEEKKRTMKTNNRFKHTAYLTFHNAALMPYAFVMHLLKQLKYKALG